MICSRATAEAALSPLRQSRLLPLLDQLGGVLGVQTWALGGIAFVLNWLRALLTTFPSVAFLRIPLAYVCVNLLRHVDTPLMPVRTVATLTALASTPFLLLEEALDLGLGSLNALRWSAGTPQQASPDATEAAKKAAAAAAAAGGGGESAVAAVGTAVEAVAAVDEEHARSWRTGLIEARYVNLTLPVDGGVSFERLVDGVTLTFTAPRGATVAEQHEFVFDAIRTDEDEMRVPTRAVSVELPADSGGIFTWPVDGIEYQLQAPQGRSKDDRHTYQFARRAPAWAPTSEEAEAVATGEMVTETGEMVTVTGEMATATATATAAAEAEVVLHKPTAATTLGLTMYKINPQAGGRAEAAIIRQVEPEGRADSLLRVGEQIVQVNGVAANGGMDAANLLREAVGDLRVMTRPARADFGANFENYERRVLATAAKEELTRAVVEEAATRTAAKAQDATEKGEQGAAWSAWAAFASESVAHIEQGANWLQESARLRLALQIAFVCYLAARLRANECRAQAQKARPAATRPVSREAATDEDETICRICFGGSEMGQLISPCLCSGSMRFVHLECLTHWRAVSHNPLSYVQCESCHYRYSFRRAVYATVIRSALVLHIVTFFVLGALLLACSLLAQWLDRVWLDSAISSLARPGQDNIASLDTPSHLLASSLFSSLFAPAAWLGVDSTYVLASLTMVGVSGFLTLGMLGPILWPGHGQQNSLFFVVVVVGLLRTFGIIYRKVKDNSAKLLQTAEKMVVDVGTSPPPPPPPPPVLPAPPPAAAAGEARDASGDDGTTADERTETLVTHGEGGMVGAIAGSMVGSMAGAMGDESQGGKSQLGGTDGGEEATNFVTRAVVDLDQQSGADGARSLCDHLRSRHAGRVDALMTD